MSKSSSLPYNQPFRYSRPALDLQAMLGAQTGNPPILPVEKGATPKAPRGAKKRPTAVKKATKAPAPAKAKKLAKPAPEAPKAKAKKPASKR